MYNNSSLNLKIERLLAVSEKRNTFIVYLGFYSVVIVLYM